MMNITILAILLTVILTLAFSVLVNNSGYIRRSYYIGITLWSRWLPVAATGGYLAILAVNIATSGNVSNNSYSLTGLFSLPEMFLLFVVGPFFLTRLGNILALATAIYALERVVLGSGQMAATMGPLVMIGSAITVAVLGDKMPWLNTRQKPEAVNKLREILLMSVTVGALAVVFATIIKVHAFHKWTAVTFALSLPVPVIMGILVALFIGWLTVALGFTRHFTIPILCLPSLMVLAYITSWPSYLLVIPFAICLSLSLATADRRQINRRTRHGVQPA